MGAAFLLASFMPLSAAAATKNPSCTVSVTTEEGEVTLKNKAKILVAEGEDLEIEWSSKNGKEAELNGEEVKLSDSEEFSPEKTTTYKLVVENGSKKATCEFTAYVAEGTITTSGLTKNANKQTLSGTAEGTKKVGVEVYKEGTKKAVFKKENISVKKGKWNVSLSKRLASGEYEVRLYGDKSYELNLIETKEVTIGTTTKDNDDDDKAPAKSNGVLSVGMIPLGMGGSTTAGGNIAATLIEVRNRGTEAVHISGFGVRQSGTASVSVVTELSSLDNLGASRASAKASFKNGVAIAPSDATIEPGKFKLFTVKALLGSSVQAGSTVVLDVVSVISNAKSIAGTFPIRGNVWNIQ
jgi:hypothetical protein